MTKKLIVENGVESYVDLSTEEISQFEEQRALQELERSTQPSQEELKEAEFELKLIAKLTDWGIF